MHILCLGLNHQTAGLSLRERLSFSQENLEACLSGFACRRSSGAEAFAELVILSTCNRVEVYALSDQESFKSLEIFLAQARCVPLEELRPHLYRRLDGEAAAHLFRVAAGLDSLVLGEPQILGQVMNACELARGQGAAGPVLSRLFQAALHGGKRARSETAIGQNPSSIASVAARLVEESVASLEQARVVVLGAGEMAGLALEALRKRGLQQFLVVSRSLERARRLSARWQGQAAAFEELPAALQEADILFTSTGAPHPILHQELVRRALAARPERPLVIFDIAVPRDVEAAVGEIPRVLLYDLDTLQERLKDSLARRAREIPQVEAILEQELVAFQEYLHSLQVTPVIAAMYRQAEAIRRAELQKTLRRMPGLSPEEQRRLEALTETLVKKLLNAPVTRLRTEAGSRQAAHFAAAARDLFGLEHGAPGGSPGGPPASLRKDFHQIGYNSDRQDCPPAE